MTYLVSSGMLNSHSSGITVNVYRMHITVYYVVDVFIAEL